MSMQSFDAVVASSHFFAPIAASADARYVYDSILSSPRARIAMHDAVCADRPAIYPVIAEIEAYHDEKANCDFDLTNDQVRQAFGRLVAEAVRPFGYVPKKVRSKGAFGSEFHYFRTGKKYELRLSPEEVVEKKIVPVARP